MPEGDRLNFAQVQRDEWKEINQARLKRRSPARSEHKRTARDEPEGGVNQGPGPAAGLMIGAIGGAVVGALVKCQRGAAYGALAGGAAGLAFGAAAKWKRPAALAGPVPAAEAAEEAAKPPENLTALCLSGGGIRSATFNLGVIQGLARLGLLDKFDYLSTVSGGGYIGSWLTAWITQGKEHGGMTKVITDLSTDATLAQPEPKPVKYLRDYGRFLSPDFSVLSADTWTLVSIYVRNLFLNWLVLIPLLLSVLLLPRIYAAVVELFPILDAHPQFSTATAPSLTTTRSPFSAPAGQTGVESSGSSSRAATQPTCAADAPKPETLGTAPRSYVYLLYTIGWLCVAWAFGYALWNEPPVVEQADQRPPPQRRWAFQTRFLVFCLVPMILCGFIFSIAWAWDENGTNRHYWGFLLFLSPLLLVALFVAAPPAEGFTRWSAHIVARCGATIAGTLMAGTCLWLSAKLLEASHDWSAAVFPGRCETAAGGLETALYVCCALPLVLISLGLGGMLRVGLLSRLSDSTDMVREWWSRFGAWLLIATVVWIVLSVLVLFAPWAFFHGPMWVKAVLAASGGASGVATILLGKSRNTPATRDAARISGRGRQIVLALVAPFFVCFVIAALSLATDGLLSIRFPIPRWAGNSLDCWASHHLGHRAPCATGSAWHFAMIEVFDDPTECDEHLQSLLRQRIKPPEPELKCEVHDDRAGAGLCLNGAWKWASGWVSNFTSEVRQAQWDWHAGVSTERLARYQSHPPGSGQVAQIKKMLDHELDGQVDGLLLVGCWLAALAATGLAFSFLIDLNRFSLHGTYRNRLVRAYLGAYRNRNANPFMGFDERDNFPMHRLRGEGCPLHVMNMALNLSSSTSRPLSWADRKAESFTVSPLHCGSKELDYRDTRRYGGRKGISVGTAMAISGAAVSPNMGYHTSPVLSFLLTLFNVRLGAWLGNPGTAGDKTFRWSAPWNAAWYVVLEALGLADGSRSYVYLSDGGHFDNLGLYEMVRRKCKTIVVCDGSADPDYGFEDLASAIRKIRIDFGIGITFDPSISIVKLSDSDVAKGKYCAVGKIYYGPGDEGDLVYIKPAFYKRDEPVDVRTYAKQVEAFPHESTANQFFTETQFESYRALGAHIIDEIKGKAAGDVGTMDAFIKRVKATCGRSGNVFICAPT